MFENFSSGYEKTFRTLFIIWVSFWSMLNIVTLLSQYASFDKTETGNNLAFWLITTVGTVFTITFGLVSFSFILSIPKKIEDGKKVGNIGFMISIAVMYYLFVSFVELVGTAFFQSEEFVSKLVFSTAWLLPSIVFMVFHIFYFVNIIKYNEELLNTKTVQENK